MDSLANIGEFVKATEFIGQSSGKNSKGQSQKTQQAVLQKFRSGGYNVIVATSIGEEGLDIMEVDLVICFDANISPLRMTQRMGRTGRKHNGRVVVLACEGSEIKAYRRKLEKSKAMKKHMRNASKSFDFHSSPRMIPHVFKPEVEFIELSIEEYIPQGRTRAKSDKEKTRFSVFNTISDQERLLLEKYFNNSRESTTWKPSLIAFPGCQTVPSMVYKVHHSMRTANMLIAAMQQLQGIIALSKSSEPVLNVESPSMCERIPAFRDIPIEPDNLEPESPVISTEMEEPRQSTPEIITKCNKLEGHHFLFGGENFMSVDLSGYISVFAEPSFPFNLSSFLNNQPAVPKDVPITEENEEESDLNLSPRLTYYIKEGVVPESPMVIRSTSVPLNINISSPRTVKPQMKDIGVEMNEKLYTPLVNHNMRESSSEDWRVMSGNGASSSVKRPIKYKRLRKMGEVVKRRVCDDMEEGCFEVIPRKHDIHADRVTVNGKQADKGKKEKHGAFIEDEAEVSKDATGSDDENSEDEDTYEDSFIDDTINPSEKSSEAQPSGDMLAFYRRSLLTQSPAEALPRHMLTPHNSISGPSTSNSVEIQTPNSHQALKNSNLYSIDCNSLTRQPDLTRSDLVNRLTSNADMLEKEFANKLETRKRKLDFQRNADSNSMPNEKPVEVLGYNDNDDDDDFYNSIDFDLMEAQATELLRQKANSIEKKNNIDSLYGPSFDLGF